MPELLLPRLKREIEARLRELRPFVEEARQLDAAKRALLDDAPPARTRRVLPSRALAPEAAPASSAVSAAADVARPARPPSTHAPALVGREALRHAVSAPRAKAVEEPSPRATNSEVIIALVEERPGVSVAEIASVTKIAKPTVATTVSKLKREGVLADEAGGVKLASRQPLTLATVAAPARKEAVSDAEWEAAQPGKSNGASA